MTVHTDIEIGFAFNVYYEGLMSLMRRISVTRLAGIAQVSVKTVQLLLILGYLPQVVILPLAVQLSFHFSRGCQRPLWPLANHPISSC